MNIAINKTAQPKPKPDENSLGFGKYFTDHMLVCDYDRATGWHDARIVPFGELSIHPASTVLHYGSEIFEGMKAYRTPDGDVQLFRPIENARRMNRSAERLGLPEMDENDLVELFKAIVTMDKDWVPHAPNTSLYIRPFMFGNDPHLGVHSINAAKLVIILSPVGSYYKEGLNPVRITIETEDVRAVRGGTGYAKCGGNYAASVRAGEKAEKLGFSQVLWLDGVERKYIEEVGSMNVMFKIGNEIVTPLLTGSVLPGITRKSCIELLKGWGLQVSERLLSADELFAAAENGTLTEAWGTGTAAVVSPIGTLAIGGREYTIGDGGIGEITAKLFKVLTDIQWGRAKDTHGWTVKL
ncbi:MAG: branched-chain amino acid aminotransferase [Clostridia bacterium]|nr:branched-chain amino acid aminotransferase [Clostridia bacterium]